LHLLNELFPVALLPEPKKASPEAPVFVIIFTLAFDAKQMLTEEYKL
jgi:hypothetical protein